MRAKREESPREEIAGILERLLIFRRDHGFVKQGAGSNEQSVEPSRVESIPRPAHRLERLTALAGAKKAHNFGKGRNSAGH